MSTARLSPPSGLVWSPGGVPVEDWKFRSLRRVWLPLYDIVALYVGIVGLLFGSPILLRLFTPGLVEGSTGAFALFALGSLIGVAVPRLWMVEIACRCAVVGMVAAYVATILVFGEHGSDGLPNLFVIGILVLGMPFSFLELTILGEEWRDRRLVEQGVA